jgi:DNA-binding NarL/FixJ family response regulator
MDLSPDVVLMDLQLPGQHGTEATGRSSAQRPSTAVLVLTMFEDDDTAFTAVAALASGYLLEPAD